MAEDLIQHYIDKASFEGDTKFALDQLSQLEGAFAKLRDSRVNLQNAVSTKDIAAGAKEATAGVQNLTAAVAQQTSVLQQNVQVSKDQNNSLQQNIKNLNDYKKALKDNADFQKQALKDVQSGVITADEYRQKITDLTTAQFKYKQAISDTTKEIKNQTLLQSAAPTSIIEAKTQNAQLTKQRDLLPTTDVAGIAQLNALIDKNNQLIDANSDKLAKQKINVGNYGPSVKAALSVVETELEKINAQLAVTDKGTAAFSQLTSQANLLKSVATGLDQPFTSTRAELKDLTEASQQVAQGFGLTSEQFLKFSEAVGAQKNKIDDVKKTLNFQASDTKGFDVIVAGVKSVTGAYGAYQAAAVLAGGSDEELQKQMVKLQAALTLVTSIQALANELTTKSALVQGLLAAKTQLLSAAQEVVAIASGKASVAIAAEAKAAEASSGALTQLATTETETATAGEGIAVTSSEGAAAMDAEAVSAGALAGGLDTVVVSEGAVAAGASTMATAIAATGIGLILVGLAIAVYKIVSAISDWRAETESIQKANKDLAKSMKDLIDATAAYDAVRKLSGQQTLADLQNQINQRKALGVTQAEALALDKQVATQRAKNAADDVATLGVTKQKLDLAKQQTAEASKALAIEQKFKQEYISSVQAGAGDKDYDKRIKSFDDRIQQYKDDYDAKKANLDLGLAAFTENTAAQEALTENNNQAAKLSADDRRKFVQQSAILEADTQTAQNDRVLNNDRSTLAERLAALQSNLDQQKKIINANNTATQLDPTVSKGDKIIAAKTAAAALVNAQQDADKKIADEKEAARIKDLQAETDSENKILDVITQTNTAIANNDAITEQQRLEGLQKSALARKQILDNNFKVSLSSAGISDPDIERIKNEGFFEISNKKITDAELKKLIADYNLDELALAKDLSTEKIKIVKDYYEQYQEESDKALKKIQRENDSEANGRADAYNKDIISLNQSYSEGLLSTQEYNSEKLKLDDQYAKDSLLIQISGIEKQLAASRSAAEVEKQLTTELNNLKAQDTSKLTDDELKVHDDRIKQVTDELKTIQEAVGKESDLYKQLSKLKKDLSDQDLKITTDSLQQIATTLQDIGQQAQKVFSLIANAVNAGVTRQKNALQEQSDLLDKNSAKELDAINSSTLSEEDKAAKVQLLNARTQAQKDQIALKQKKLDQENAVAQKASAVFQIALNTAVAVVKALPNLALSFLVGALGAAEMAIAIATPIPKFKTGKTNSYEGLAIVGDGGVPEYIKREDGTLESTPAHNTLTHLNRNDIVFPDWNSVMRSFATPPIKSVPVNTEAINNATLYAEMKKQTASLVKIASRRENHISAKEGALVSVWKHGANMSRYIQENTNW